jgi:predicted O-methyltransferase YrrM
MVPGGDAGLGRALQAIDGVEGWLSPAQATRLWHAVERTVGRMPAGEQPTIVEIGSFRGRSTIVLASAAGDGAEVVAIDPHAGNDRGPREITGFAAAAESDRSTFEANLEGAGVRGRVRHVRRASGAAHDDVTGSVDLLFVDGAHRVGPARADVRQWGDRVIDGGTMLVHDAFSSIGVTLALLTSVTFGARWRYVGHTRSLVEYRREPMPAPTRAKSIAAQLALLPWFAWNVAIKAATVARLRRGPWPY